MKGCVFCDYGGPNPIVKDYGSAFVIEPLNPVTEGHVLVIPRRHVDDFAVNWYAAGGIMGVTHTYLRDFDVGPCNVITSVGREATQTVMHLHVHVVPRREGDGLMLPWSPTNGGNSSQSD